MDDAFATQTFKHLWRINRAFERVGRSLAAFATRDAFDRRELERFRALVQEAQAATNSYRAHTIDSVQSTEAGRLFRRGIGCIVPAILLWFRMSFRSVCAEPSIRRQDDPNGHSVLI